MKPCERCRTGRQLNGKGRYLSRTVGNGKPSRRASTIQCTIRKSQPGATQAPGPSFIDTIEAIENVKLISFRNADAGVAHHHLSVRFSQQFDTNLSAFGRVLPRYPADSKPSASADVHRQSRSTAAPQLASVVILAAARTFAARTVFDRLVQVNGLFDDRRQVERFRARMNRSSTIRERRSASSLINSNDCR